jgi:DNA polymerase III sliding clamp (beta) subunit (PCNA family)
MRCFDALMGMGFAVRAGDIKRVVKAIAQSGSERKSLMPDILRSYTNMRQEGETVTMEARTGNVYITSRLQVVPMLDGDNIRALVPKKAFKDLISTYDDDSILTFRHTSASNAQGGQASDASPEEQLIVQSTDKSKYHIKCISPEEWSGLFTELEGSKVEFFVPAQLLLHGIQKVAFAAAEEDARESLNGINFTINQNQIRLVGTDAVTLSMCIIKDIDTNIPKTLSFTLPNDTVETLENFFDDEDQSLIKITVIHDKDEQVRMVGFSNEKNTIYSYVISYPFPSIDGIIKPESEYKVFVVNKEKFIESVRRFQKIADSKEQTFNISISGSTMILKQYSYNFGEGEEIIEIDRWNGGEVTLTFFISRIVSILSNIVGVEEVRVGIQEPNRPIAFFYEDESESTQVQILTMPALR